MHVSIWKINKNVCISELLIWNTNTHVLVLFEDSLFHNIFRVMIILPSIHIVICPITSHIHSKEKFIYKRKHKVIIKGDRPHGNKKMFDLFNELFTKAKIMWSINFKRPLNEHKFTHTHTKWKSNTHHPYWMHTYILEMVTSNIYCWLPSHTDRSFNYPIIIILQKQTLEWVVASSSSFACSRHYCSIIFTWQCMKCRLFL